MHCFSRTATVCVRACGACASVQTKGGDVFVEQNEPVKVAAFTDRSVELCVRACVCVCVCVRACVCVRVCVSTLYLPYSFLLCLSLSQHTYTHTIHITTTHTCTPQHTHTIYAGCTRMPLAHTKSLVWQVESGSKLRK